MTPEELRQIDYRVATEVMGWLPHARNTAHWTDADKANLVDYPIHGYTPECSGAWRPTTRPTAWDTVLDKLAELGCWTLAWIPRNKKFVCTIFRNDEDKPDIAAEAETKGLAICLCALKAVEVSNERT